jgi:glycerol-3-phosphate O-acyltransferase / dihydroxyacetone phosphate acyltransferase
MIFFYRLLQVLASIACEGYFSKIVYINRERTRERSPLILVSNHPNTLLDPLVGLMYVRQNVHVLANYSLFKNPILGAVLRFLFCIPVQRTQDVGKDKALQNADAFEKSKEHLLRGGNLYICPEGSSYTERHIRECKTGTARIAFLAETEANYKLNLRILPIGVTYDDPLKFGSNVVVEYGKAFSIEKWANAYAENPHTAVEDLTQHIENQLIEHTIHCRNVAEDHFLQKVETILQSERPLDVAGRYSRSRIILRKLHEWQEVFFDDYIAFSSHIQDYFEKLEALKLQDVKLSRPIPPLSIVQVLVSLPLLLAGLVVNGIPAWLSNKMISWLKVDSAYDTTVRVCAGLIFFPLFWWLQTELFCHWFLPPNFDFNWWQTLALTLSFVVLGWLAWGIYTEGGKILNYFRYKRLNNKYLLSDLRQPIIEQLATLN